jgi:phenylacetate-CoA ligase
MAIVTEREVRRLCDAYEAAEPASVAAWQLARVNALWSQATRRIPHYIALKEAAGLPEEFGSLDEFVRVVPPLEKADLQVAGAPCSFQMKPPDRYRATGGSTGAPVQIPAWNVEFRETRADPWLGRSWYGVQPRDRLFLYWGHSHLLGSGWRGQINGLLRFAKDTVLGYVRYSAYDLSDAAVRKAADALLIARPVYMIGYSYALDRLARLNEDRTDALQALHLKTVIATGESPPFADSIETIERVFGCPVALEYGAVETGVLAHSAPGAHMRALWRSHLLETGASEGGGELFVTTLTARCTPLFRYRIGDVVDMTGAKRQGGISLMEFRGITGRSNLPLRLPSGRTLHSEVVSHLVRDIPGVAGYQFVCGQDALRLHLVMSDVVSAELRNLLLNRASKIDEELGAIMTVDAVPELRRSVAGKTPMVVFE